MDDTLTLPGTIPGLLRRGSPVRLEVAGHPYCGVVLDDTRDDGAAVCWMNGDYSYRRLNDFDLNELALDLSDPTGRAHAAWWVESCWCNGVGSRGEVLDATRLARNNQPMTDVQVEALRSIVLHLAGVTNV